MSTFPDYPFQSHFFQRNNLRLHYIDEGPKDAPPIVLLHGNPTWSYFYRRLISALSSTHRCIAPDHIGMGLSDKPPESQYTYTLKSRVDDLEALLDSLIQIENRKSKIE